MTTRTEDPITDLAATLPFDVRAVFLNADAVIANARHDIREHDRTCECRGRGRCAVLRALCDRVTTAAKTMLAISKEVQS